MDIKLTTAAEVDLINPVIGDVHIDNGQIMFVENSEFIAQKLRIRFQFFRGEWYLDQREGFPYWERVFKKNPDINEIASLFRRAAYTTSGIAEVRSVEVTNDKNSRTMNVSVDALSDEGDVIKIVKEPFVLSI
jgi:hypothetical protein